MKAFPRLKREGIEREETLAGGWVAVFKRRKKGDGGDVYLTRPGEPALRSKSDVRRKFGLYEEGAARGEEEADG